MQSKKIKMSFVGDLMCEKEQLDVRKIGIDYDFSSILASVKSAFGESDYTIGNLETPIAGEELEYSSRKWSFNSPIGYAKSVKEAGFDLVSTANNHCLDRGPVGIINTLNNLDKIGLEHVGTNRSFQEQDKLLVKDIKGVKVAFLSYTYGTNAGFNQHYLNKRNTFLVNFFRPQEPTYKYSFKGYGRIMHYREKIRESAPFNIHFKRMQQDIEKAKAESDFIVVLMHSGGQYNLIPDKWTTKLLNRLLSYGVHAIIGCHPHVVQKGISNSNRQVGFFSLGNFCSYPGRASTEGKDLKSKSEYSIILHLHLCTQSKKLEKVTFQVAKSVIDTKKRANVHLLYDLIEQEKDEHKKKRLIADNDLIIKRLLNTEDVYYSPKKEYEFRLQ